VNDRSEPPPLTLGTSDLLPPSLSLSLSLFLLFSIVGYESEREQDRKGKRERERSDVRYIKGRKQGKTEMAI